MSELKFKIHSNIKIGIGVFLIVLIGALSFYSLILGWNIECQKPDRLFTIPKGASAHTVAILLKEESCLENIIIFKLWM